MEGTVTGMWALMMAMSSDTPRSQLRADFYCLYASVLPTPGNVAHVEKVLSKRLH